MDIKRKKYIKYPYEYFAAQVAFGLTVAKILKKSKISVFKKYTDLYGALANHSWGDIPENSWVNAVLEKFETLLKTVRNSETLSRKVYELFLTTPYIYERATHAYKKEPLRFGPFILNYSDYYKTQKIIRLHFSPLREGLSQISPELRVSDLDPIYMPKRKNDFEMMISYIYDNPKQFKGATHFFSSTWLQNLPEYQSFFPSTERKVETRYFYWLWGQFIRWDYSGNERRCLRFIEKLQNAKSIEDAINCIPFKVYEVKIPLEEMFSYYNLGLSPNESENVDTNPLLAQFYTNLPLQTQIAYQSQE